METIKQECVKFREMIGEADNINHEELKQHLAKCPECREAAADWGMLAQLKLVEIEVPQQLDFAVRGAARKALKQHSHRRFWIYFAAAACVMIFAWGIMAAHLHRTPPANSRHQQLAASSTANSTANNNDIDKIVDDIMALDEDNSDIPQSSQLAAGSDNGNFWNY